MRHFTILLLAVVGIYHCDGASLERVRRQALPREFANINIENYLKNERAVQFQLKCIVYDGPCDRIGKYLKVTIPELLTNQCQNCDPASRQRAGRLVQHIQQKFPKEWSDAVKKFQGGQVKKEDADRLKSLLGVELDSKLIADSPTSAPVVIASSTVAATDASSSVAPIAVAVTPAAVVPVAVTPAAAAPAAVVPAAVAPVEVAPVAVAPVAVAPVVAAPAAVAEISTTQAPSSLAPVIISSEVPLAVAAASTAAPPAAVASAVPVLANGAAPEVSSTPVPAASPIASVAPVVVPSVAPEALSTVASSSTAVPPSAPVVPSDVPATA